MIKLFLKFVTRNITRNFTFSVINIVGFAIGLTCSLMILLWIRDELSFDRFHKDNDQIYRLVSYGKKYMQDGYIGGPYDLAQASIDVLPKIKEAVPIYLYTLNLNLRYEDKKFFEDKIMITDSSFFNVFNFEILAGDPQELKKNPNSIIITESLAKKYFGDENPINKIIISDYGNLNIGLVLKDPPSNSSFDFRIILPFNFFISAGNNFNSWSSFMTSIFLKIEQDADLTSIETQLTELARENNCNQVIEGGVEFKLQALNDIHTDSHHGSYLTYMRLVDRNIIKIFSAIALIILVLAVINYVNLATANTLQRRKEISIKKIAGASRSQIIGYLMGESFLIIFIAFDLAILFVELFINQFNLLTGKSLGQHLIFQHDNIYIVIILFLIVWVLSSIYPATLISASKPIDILRKSTSGVKNKILSHLKNVLVVFQFCISVALIIGAINIYRQITFLQNKDLGFNIENLIYINNKGEIAENYNYFKEELLKNPDISHVTIQDHLWIKSKWHTTGLRWEGITEEDDDDMQMSIVGFDFLETFNIKLIEGRGFDSSIPSDSAQAYILNKTAVKQMGVENPIGYPFSFYRNGVWNDGKIIGVIDDLHFESLYHPIDPFFFALIDNPENYTNMGAILIKHSGNNLQTTIKTVENLWNKLEPNIPFFYETLTDTYFDKYKKTRNIGLIILLFSILAIIISCMGLFGMSTFMIDKRQKEIAVRKVNGATSLTIFKSLLMYFSRGLIISLILAIPISYFFINRWLQTFAYQTDVSYVSFIISILFVFTINTLTIFVKTFKAARSNPIESLRYE